MYFTVSDRSVSVPAGITSSPGCWLVGRFRVERYGIMVHSLRYLVCDFLDQETSNCFLKIFWLLNRSRRWDTKCTGTFKRISTFQIRLPQKSLVFRLEHIVWFHPSHVEALIPLSTYVIIPFDNQANAYVEDAFNTSDADNEPNSQWMKMLPNLSQSDDASFLNEVKPGDVHNSLKRLQMHNKTWSRLSVRPISFV